MSWRKGTGLASSPADRGRDIECHFEQRDIDGAVRLEKWFVECKHYEKGVPAEKLQGAVSWARAERPDKLLFIASNFLSNPAKDHLDALERNERPFFIIKRWERPDLEKLTVGKTKLRRKYNIGGGFPHLALMHPAHIMYSSNLNINTLEYLFELLDKLDDQKREELLGYTSFVIVNPRIRDPISGDEKFGDLIVDDCSYTALKEKCFSLTQTIPRGFVVEIVVDHILRTVFHSADQTRIEGWKETDEWMIKDYQEQIERGRDPEFYQSMIEITTKKLQSVEQRTKQRYQLYEYFCKNVIVPLLTEKLAPIEEQNLDS